MFLVQVAACALTTYDIILTLPLEVALVWRGHWGVPAVTYMVNRYGILIHSFVIMVLTPAIYSGQDSNATYCEWWSDIGLWSIPFVTLLGEALLTMRVVAFYGQKRRPAIILWSMYGLSASGNVAMMLFGFQATRTFSQTSGVDSLGSELTCVADQHGTAWIFWIPGMAMESVLVLCTLARAHHFWTRGIRPHLVQVITEDHLLYFIGIFVLMVINVSLCAMPSLNSIYGLVLEFTLCLNSVLASRIFLHLRVACRPERLDTGETVDDASPDESDSTASSLEDRRRPWFSR